MPAARVISNDSQELLALHLRRLGFDPPVASQLAPIVCGVHVLLTGFAEHELRALEAVQGLPPTLFGDAERARGSALVYSQREQLKDLARKMTGPLAEMGRHLLQAIERTAAPPAPMRIGRRTFEWGSRTYLMGVVNVTPDSFSDGGKHATADTAVAAGERLAAEGVDLIDIGGESTRPGSEPVPVEKELSRVVPVVERLSKLVDVPLSVDTTKAKVVEEAARAGAGFANDISGLTFDPDMAPTCARLGLPVCAMHLRGRPRTMQEAPTYFDLVGEVIEGLQASLDLAARSGLPAEQIVVDPGLGFGKTAEHNLFLLRNLGQLRALGRPILVGASRKSFIGKVTGRAVGERLPGSLAVLAAAVLGGADLIRVHDVAESKVAAQVVDAIARAREGGVAYGP
ncbi:MAG TPA: dihydropteroate synthase [Myxococcales bacterium]|jgi:dihydropteroate synthase